MADINDTDETTSEVGAVRGTYDVEADAGNILEPSDAEIILEAQARLALAEEAESDIRKMAIEDLKFISGEQWPDIIRQTRDLEARPCLVVNRLPQFVHQVTNDQRQNRSTIKVHPISDGADQATADVIQGIIRHIELNSSATTAYDTAFEASARSSFGYWRIATDFIGTDNFDQEIYIKRIRNQFSVFFDPYSQEPDGSDASFAFITDDLSPDEYKRMYPNSQMASAGFNWEMVGNQIPAWVKDASCRVAEYFYKSYKSDTLHLLSSGESVKQDNLPQRLLDAQNAGLPVSIVKSREVKVPVIKWVKINGVEILERGEWAGKYIPIVPVYGTELYINGKRTLESVIRHAIDPQRMLNYWKSAETEAIALAPRAPFIGAEGQFEGHEEEWSTANRRNHAYLEYKSTNLNGQPVGPPMRSAVEPAVQAITQASMMAADDLKATTGIYDPALGAGPPDPSGIAIQRRQNQSSIATYHFGDNLKRSLRHTGRILVDLIPHIYDTARTARIIQDDGEQKLVALNRMHKDESGKEVIYDLDAGLYDVSIDTGPSFASKRQEAATSMLEFTRAVPQIAASCADIIVRNMDWPGAQDLADRIKKTLPPQLQDDPKQQQIPPQAQAMLQQQDALIKHLTIEANKNAEIIKTKQIETMNKKMELEHDERIEIAKIQADIEINMAKLKMQSATTLLEHQVAEIESRMKVLGNQIPIGDDNVALAQAYQQFDPGPPAGGAAAGMGQGSQPSTGGQSPGQPMGSNP